MANGDAVATSFADALGGLLSVVGQNVRLQICGGGEGVSVVRVLGNGYQVTAGEKVDDKPLELTLGDVYSEESKDILFDVRLPDCDTDATVHSPQEITLKLSYVDVVHGKLASAIASADIARASSVGAPDEEVAQHMNRLRTVEALEGAAALAQRRRYSEGCDMLAAAMAELTASVVASSPMTTQLLADLRNSQKGMRSPQQYSSRGAFECQSALQSHKRQRANSHATPMGGRATKASPYDTSIKRQLKAKWAAQKKPRLPKPPKAPQLPQPPHHLPQQQKPSLAIAYQQVPSSLAAAPSMARGTQPQSESFVMVEAPLPASTGNRNAGA
eukprot:SAG25_NODE_2690_length_1447_cov_2.933976_1_plen_330_part_00